MMGVQPMLHIRRHARYSAGSSAKRSARVEFQNPLRMSDVGLRSGSRDTTGQARRGRVECGDLVDLSAGDVNRLSPQATSPQLPRQTSA